MQRHGNSTSQGPGRLQRMERAGWEAAWASGVPVTLHVLPGVTGFMGAHRIHPPLQMVYVLFYMCVLHVYFHKAKPETSPPHSPCPFGLLMQLALWGHWVGSRRGLRRKKLAQPLRWPWVNKSGSSTFLLMECPPARVLSHPCPSPPEFSRRFGYAILELLVSWLLSGFPWAG